MRNLLSAGRVLALDLASTILFLAVYLLTDNLFLAVGLGMALGVAQIAWQYRRKHPIGSLQWLSVVLVLASGTATFLTHDPTFVMLKPSVIYCIVGAYMLRPGWMNRYLPPIAVQGTKRTFNAIERTFVASAAEIALIAEMLAVSSDDVLEALDAVAQKRKGNFLNRCTPAAAGVLGESNLTSRPRGPTEACLIHRLPGRPAARRGTGSVSAGYRRSPAG